MEPISKFTWGKCVRLCVPALILGALFRISLLMAIPEAAYPPDGGSYFETAHYLHNKGSWKFGLKRRWLYPILLVGAPALPGSTLQTAAVVQQSLSLASLLGIGWIVGHLSRRPRLFVPMATLLAAVWPQTLYYGHELVAESLFLDSFILMAALAFPLEGLRDRRRLLLFLLAATLVIAIKPHGRGVWAGAFLLAAVVAWKQWAWFHWATLAAGLGLMATSGNPKQGNWLLLSSVLPLVKTSGEPASKARESLRPVIEQVNGDPLQFPWKQHLYKKRLISQDPSLVSPSWAKLVRDDKQFSIATRALCFDALKSHPLLYAQMLGLKIGVGLAERDFSLFFDPSIFWNKQNTWNKDRFADPSRIAELKLLYGWDPQTYWTKVEARAKNQNWIVAPIRWVCRTFALVRAHVVDGEHRLHPGWFGWLAIWGILGTLNRKRFLGGAILLAPTLLYLATVYGVGDALPRYAMPIEWIGILFACLGIDWLLGWAVDFFKKLRPLAPAQPSAPSSAQMLD